MKEVNSYLNNLLNFNDTIIISCSGGPDSMCLLSLLLQLKQTLNLNIILAHVNHKVREESEEEQAYLESFAKDNNIIFELLTIDKYEKSNFHDEAREKRYIFLDSLMKKYNGKYLFTAHHGDDLIETILMRLERGSNLTGYAGFKKEMNHNNYKVIRPLISLSKQELADYNDSHNIKYFIDNTNYSEEYKRNYYRIHILPLLHKANKNIQKKYLKYSQELYEYDNYIKKIIEEKEIIVDNYLLINKYLEEDTFLKRKIIEEYIKIIQQEYPFYINDNITKEIAKCLNSKKANIIIDLPNGFEGIKEYNKFYIKKQNVQLEYDILFKDIYEDDNWIIKTDVTDDEDDSNYTFRFLKKELSLPIHIRVIKTNDYIYIKNLNGKKKVSDVFKDCKIPLTKRKTYPLITDNDNNILGIPGLKKSKFNKDKSQKYDIIFRCKEK